MGISLPPEIKELHDRVSFESQAKVIHVYVEAKRYFEPDVHWVASQIGTFDKKGKDVKHYVLCETMQTYEHEHWRIKLSYTWMNSEPFKELHPSGE